MKKGLRQDQRFEDQRLEALKPCPDEEGIKTNPAEEGGFDRRSLKPCPDEEGIKTRRVSSADRHTNPLKPCPDEEGIKTT